MKSYKSCYKAFHLIFITVLIIPIILSPHIFLTCHADTHFNLKAKANVILSVSPDSSMKDIENTSSYIKNKAVIGFAECTHGTKEIYKLRDKYFRFLVEKMGFTTFAMEANFDDARKVNDYITTGKGNVNQLVCNTWPSKELFDMVVWMKNYNMNTSHKKKVKFYGFDMDTSDKSRYAKVLIQYLQKVDIRTTQTYGKTFSTNNFLTTIYSVYDDSLKLANMNYINSLKTILIKNKSLYTKKSSLEEYEIALQYVELLRQDEEYIQNDGDSIIRDKYMAKNALWIINHESQSAGGKTMLSAQTHHLNKQGTSMGNYIKEIYADKYYLINTEIYSGKVFSRPGDRLPPENIPLSVPSKDTFSYELQKLPYPICYIDFKSASKDSKIKNWLSTPQLFHSFGFLYTGYGYVSYIPSQSFDAVIFIKSTSASEVCTEN